MNGWHWLTIVVVLVVGIWAGARYPQLNLLAKIGL